MRPSIRFVAGLVCAAVLCAPVSQAAPRHWYRDWKWWAGEGAIVTAVVLDGQSTCAAFRNGFVEGAPLLRGTHSCATTAGVLIGAAGFYTTMHALEWHYGHDDSRRVIRALTPFMVPTAPVILHTTAAIHNYELNERQATR